MIYLALACVFAAGAVLVASRTLRQAQVDAAPVQVVVVRGCARVSALGGGFAGMLGLAPAVARGALDGVGIAFGAILVGFAGSVACVAVGRRVRALVRPTGVGPAGQRVKLRSRR